MELSKLIGELREAADTSGNTGLLPYALWAKAADSLEAMARELAEARADVARLHEALSAQGVKERDRLQEALDYLAENKSRSLAFDGKTFCEDDNSDLWIVTEVQGGLNDREWVLLGSGDTPAKALIDALPSSGIRASLATEKEGRQ